MGATRTVLATDLDRIIGNRGTTATTAVTYVQRAHQVFQASVEVPESLKLATATVADGAATTALPGDFYSVKSVTFNDGVRLTQVSPQRYDTLDRTVEGRPTHYMIDGDSLETWPKADEEYNLNLRYRARLPLMSTDNTTTGCAVEYDQVILYLACAMAFMDFNEIDRAKEFERAAARLLSVIQPRAKMDLDDRNEPLGVVGLFKTPGGM